ncbi:MAG: hypothetical protein JWP97_1119 [Labilithrix sp.]|nr:hypothetical protein [Labilithrix sp.]
MGLREYNEKRSFTRTPEPAGEKAAARPASHPRVFVVQKHAASHLHYDFRLELEGVLKSWSVPKGPSLDPEVHRLAMATEDHPIAYVDFEGVIPKGQYGGGTVIVWDAGTWASLDANPHQAYRAGKLHFELHGKKLTGAFTLVRKGKDDRAWLLTKNADAESDRGSDVVTARPESVVTGRTIEEVAAARDRVWHSNRGHTLPELEIEAARQAKPPRSVALAVPVVRERVPTGDAFLHELDLPGERMQAWFTAGSVRLEKKGADRTRDHRAIVEALEETRLQDAILDGIVVDQTYVVFDLLRLEGKDLRPAPLEARKRALETILSAAPKDPHLHFSSHVVGSGKDYFEKACSLGARGVVSKRRDAPHGARGAWQVVRCAKEGEGAIAGIEISNPSRVMYPARGITKWEVARYYEEIGEHLLPHVAGRPLTLVRCGAGLTTGRMREDCTFMKHGRVWGPKALRRVNIQEKTKIGEYLVADDLAGIIALVQMDVLEIHTWNSLADRADLSNRVVFDLDPGPHVSWSTIVRAAGAVRARLTELGLACWVKTTGGNGLHVVVPVAPAPWEKCLAFARLVSRSLVKDDPKTFTTSIVKTGRTRKIYLDDLRNNRGNTSVSAYSTRARPEGPVSVPVTWDELGDTRPTFDMETVRQRLRTLREDPWKDYFACEQRLPGEPPVTRARRRKP